MRGWGRAGKAFACGWAAGAIACLTPLSPADLEAAKREEQACIDREDDAACKADRAACQGRIDACRAAVREKYVKR